jgi:gliding motility-associated lipoprotein GldD
MIEMSRSLRYTCILLPALSIIMAGCFDDEEIVPRPRGYFRIDLPSPTYQRYDSTCPFSFDFSSYSQVEPDSTARTENCWINIFYPKFHATLHLSYKKVDNNLATYLEQSRQMAIQHQIKANAMKESPVNNPNEKVYGLIYEFGGNAASTLQFYITDSTQHFMRGALYFWAKPNADSIAPVEKFVKDDIYRMVESFKWK